VRETASGLEERMITRILAKSLYGLVGGVFLIAGVSVLLYSTPLLPSFARELIETIARGEPNTLHILQEFGSLLIFAGLISFWFVQHYEESRVFHWAMTLFWILFALVHWVDIRGSLQVDIGQLINSIPAALFVTIGVLRERTRKR
jgi:hypothetical protein